MTLEEYFKLIVKPPQKEQTMFERSVDYIKAKWTELFTHTWAFKDPVQARKEIDRLTDEILKAEFELREKLKETETPQKDGWAFAMVTEPWTDENNDLRPLKATAISGDNDGTWMETLDQILDVLGHHYGYNIKEQVYYSVAMPVNTGHVEGWEVNHTAGNTRNLNDEVLQQLLLAYPEVYDWKGHEGFKL
jgi:hypothetical protein